MDEPSFFVVRKRDDSPVEVIPYSNLEAAEVDFESMSEQWSECYLCSILKPLRQKLYVQGT